MDRHVACIEELRNAYSILIGKPEGKNSHGRPMHGWEDNIRMYLKGYMVGRCGLD
jgi:hypothetical protein